MRPVCLVHGLVVNHARAVFTPAKHWFDEFLKAIACDSGVIDQKEFVCASHDADVDLCDAAELFYRR